MHSKTFLTVFALTTAVAAVPLPTDQWGTNPPKGGLESTIKNLMGSPFGNGNGNGNGNSAGNDNDGNAAGNGNNNGNKNGNGNIFGNGNDILSGNSGLGIGRRNDAPKGKDPMSTWIDGLIGSPFGNGNGNGNGNSAGNGNDDNGSGNGVGNGNGNGNGNIFGNGNDILSGNSGLKIGRNEQPKKDPLTTMIENLMGSPFGNGNGNGNGNKAGNGNDGNAAGNGVANGNGNGNKNQFGNENDILSGNSGLNIGGKKVRRDLPPNALDLIPAQNIDAFGQVLEQGVTVLPESLTKVLGGALTGQDQFQQDGPVDSAEKRQVLTGVESVIAQTIGKVVP